MYTFNLHSHTITGDNMNRSHKHQLEKLNHKDVYTKDDLEIAQELLKQEDPPFHKEVERVIEKIKKALKENNHE